MTSPTNGSGASTVHRLRNTTRFGKEFVIDRPIVSLWGGGNLVGNLLATALASESAGAPVMAAIGSSVRTGLLIPDTNDAHEVMWRLPDDIDLAQDIEFRVLWTNPQSAATGSALWAVTYAEATVGTFDMGAVAGAETLDTIIANQVDLGTDILQYTLWDGAGVLDGGTLSGTPGDDFLSVNLACTHTTVTDTHAIDLQARYFRKWAG